MSAQSGRRTEPARPVGIRFDGLHAHLPDWAGLDDLLFRKLQSHGDFDKWRQAILGLPAPPASSNSFEDTVTVSAELAPSETKRLRDALQALHPWRKGPFSLLGVRIDSEWRSDIKWARIAPHLDLEGLRVLDVGCGNGYYGWRMLGAGAALVIGIDPSVLYCMQHQAINRLIGDDRNQVLPLALETLPEALSAGRFDAVFSMGVVYHRRDPLGHLRRVAQCLVPGGTAVIESLCAEGPQTLIPDGRYARMRNVWQVPAQRQLAHWMADSGFEDIRIVDTTVTSTAEQRTTEWMRFESLAEALDPTDSTRTVEGYPAPRRCLLIARGPGGRLVGSGGPATSCGASPPAEAVLRLGLRPTGGDPRPSCRFRSL
ncbi:MAG: tRNA 5-methoxyuridine(34)/uridine 5-oxyacetic acid(34) synthase CmoB [Gammaproteobacteria bacterium]|nr:tRNA 5-methoxyuridine(34)/uridine 5-oxyacetic acid(34) synthase CmoB [Gammaproteobacteria bacterium]MDE0368306.1 tRNA 5-methoxyuridine(34)/uridine 5-oxyacetic acid(34) synthase CmoB [Gammaproteobacteria bacterium]